MPSRRDPIRALSRRTAQSVENSPEVEAFRAGREVVPNTWGGYATRAIDLGLCEPNARDAVRVLGGSEIVELGDSTVFFESRRQFGDYHDWFNRVRTDAHTEDLKVERNRLLDTARLVISQWEIDPVVGREQADALQLRIQDEDETADIDVLCMQRDGMYDGIQVTLGEFAQEMLKVNILDEESPSELAGYWVSGIKAVVDDIRADYGYIDDFNDRQVIDLPLARSHIGGFLGEISHSYRSVANQRSMEDWEYIAPVFAVPGSLSVLDGTES